MSLELGRFDAKIEVWDTCYLNMWISVSYEAQAAGRCNYSENQWQQALLRPTTKSTQIIGFGKDLSGYGTT